MLSDILHLHQPSFKFKLNRNIFMLFSHPSIDIAFCAHYSYSPRSSQSSSSPPPPYPWPYPPPGPFSYYWVGDLSFWFSYESVLFDFSKRNLSWALSVRAVLYERQCSHLPPITWKGTSDMPAQSLHIISILVSLYSGGICIAANSASIWASNHLGSTNDFLHIGHDMLCLMYSWKHALCMAWPHLRNWDGFLEVCISIMQTGQSCFSFYEMQMWLFFMVMVRQAQHTSQWKKFSLGPILQIPQPSQWNVFFLSHSLSNMLHTPQKYFPNSIPQFWQFCSGF